MEDKQNKGTLDHLPDRMSSVFSDGLQRSTCGGACFCPFPEHADCLFSSANETARTDTRVVFPDPCKRKLINKLKSVLFVLPAGNSNMAKTQSV